MDARDPDLREAHRRVAARIGAMQGELFRQAAAVGDVHGPLPGLLVGAGPSLVLSLPLIGEPVRRKWCVMDAVPRIREGLRARRLPPAGLPVEPGLPESAAIYLALRALGCDPIVLCALDLCFTDGLVCGVADELHSEWACELGPFRTIEDQHLSLLRTGGGGAASDRAAADADAGAGASASKGAGAAAGAGAGAGAMNADARGLRMVTDRSGAPVLTTEALLLERELLERLIAEDARRGLRTMDIDQRGLAKAGAERADPTVVLARPAGPARSVDPAQGESAPCTSLAEASGAPGSARGAGRRRVRGLAPVAAAVGADRARADGTESLVAHAVDRPSASPLAESLAQQIRSGPLTLEVSSPTRVAAVVAIDPDRGGTGVPRKVDSEFGPGSVLRATLARLGQVRGIERIILIAPESFDPSPLFDPGVIPLPVEIEHCAGSPFPPEQSAIRTSRLWADTAWRGGIGGSTVWDEIVAPAAMLAALERRRLDGALCCGPDWPLVMIEEYGGCDALVDRFREARGALEFVAAPGPPGLGACVIHRRLLERLAARSGPVLIGDLWRCHPRPLDFPGCVAPVPRIRRSMVRAVFDSMRAKLRMRRAIEPVAIERSPTLGLAGIGGWAVVEALEHQFLHLPPAFVAQHLIIELNTGRRASGRASPHRMGSIQRPPMTERLLDRILEEVEAPRDVVVTFGHAGDPIWHPLLPRFIRMAHEAGVRAVHVRTELVADQARLERVLDARPDVVSVDLHADSPGTYRALMGIQHFDRAVGNLEWLLRSKGGGDPRLSTPLVVVRMQRTSETLPELASFVERWERAAGAAVVEGVPRLSESSESDPDAILPCEPPSASIRREGVRRMVILADGRVPISELDLLGERTIGSVMRSGVFELWRELAARRRQMLRDDGEFDPDLLWWQP